LLLGYLAFRGIKNDQALLQQDRLEEQRRTAGRIAAAIARPIAATEQDFVRALSQGRDSSPPALTPALDTFRRDHPLVEEVFVFQTGETIRLPIARLLFVPPGTAPAAPQRAVPASLSLLILAGQRLEFETHNYRGALTSYRESLARTTDPQTQGELVSAIARVQNKAALYRDAMDTYARVARDFAQVQSAGGIPLGLAARVELAALYLVVHDATASLKTSLDLYRTLLGGEWTIEQAQYEFFLQTVRHAVQQALSAATPEARLPSDQRAFSTLEAEEQRQRQRTDTLLPFVQGAAPDLAKTMSGDSTAGAGPFRRLTLELGKHSYLVSLWCPEPAGGARTGEHWGLLFSVDYLKNDLLPHVLKGEGASGETAWVVRGSDRQVVLASGQAPAGVVSLSAGFADNFPNWSLELHQPAPRLLGTLLGARQGIYLYMFLLMAVFLVFGMTLTVRTVSRELELATMKSDFVSTVSHEFKSPLTSIQQLAEMLQAGKIPSEERRQQYYDVLLEQIQRLSLLTDNILSLAQIDEGRREFDFDLVDLAPLLTDVVSTVQDRVRHEGFVIELNLAGGLPQVLADRRALAQAVTNLLDNAIKYSGEARRVLVGASVGPRALVISVTDFGIGIRKEDVSKVFERFYRGGDPLTRSVKGTGLGLTLVKDIVTAHHGTVSVESAPGRGSTFSILLPLRHPEVQPDVTNPDH
jgi:signal transduction histidine kinase